MMPSQDRSRNLARWIGIAAVSIVGLLGAGTIPSRGTPPGKDESGKAPSINDPRAYQGYTLLAPIKGERTYLVDMTGKVVKSWVAKTPPALGASLLEDGHLLRPSEDPKLTAGVAPGAGGLIQEFDWDGRLVWDFAYGDEGHRPHHDAIKLPNGNVLMIVWDRKSDAEAIAAGRRPKSLGAFPLQADCLVEVKPNGKTTGKVVWEWHVWDHLIQDFDRRKANFGEVAGHPELVDVNFDEGALAAILASKDGLKRLRSIGYLAGPADGKVEPDWTHFNGIDYNARLDQIAISVHSFSEVWVIDHGTSTAEAAGHSGGRSGKGGDLLYRWGNPLAYRTGEVSDRKLFHPHNAHWIPEGRPGAGHLLVFNNGLRRPGGEYSSVEEIVTPVDTEGRYARAPGKPFGPDATSWSYAAPKKSDFFSNFLSGAQRLPNGNTLICSGNDGIVFEVTPTGEVVWKFVSPEPGRVEPAPPAGQVLPTSVRKKLELTGDQEKNLDKLQKVVDETLEAVLTDEQRRRHREHRGSGPANFAPPGQVMALSTQVTLKLTAEQRKKLGELQKRVDRHLDSSLTDGQKSRLRTAREDFLRGLPGPAPGGPPGPLPGVGGIFRAYRYGPDHPGLSGRVLTPGGTVDELLMGDDKGK